MRRPRLGPYQIEVLDFSPIAVHTIRHSYGPDGFTAEDGTTQTVISRISILNNPDLFSRTILSSLPFVITTTGRHYTTEGVMIGESSLIITKASLISHSELREAGINHKAGASQEGGGSQRWRDTANFNGTWNVKRLPRCDDVGTTVVGAPKHSLIALLMGTTVHPSQSSSPTSTRRS